MPKQKKNHSEELYEWLNVKFHPVDMLNADGEETSDYDEVTTFVFEYRDDQGTSENVKVSLTDNDRKLDSDVVSKVTVEYDQDMANQINTGFSKFLTELREWARGRMLGFQVTNVETEPGKRTVQESKFSALSGTVKTSVQTLENVKIILKHTDVINDDVRGARTRKIHRIYVENAQGERFLMPFTSLRGARAMARHVAQGGNPYDATGSGISNSVAEAVSLSKFLRRTNGKQYEDVTAVGMIESARLRLAEVKKMLNGLSGVKGYSRYSSAIAERTQIEYNPEVKNHFVRNQYDEQLDNSLPYVWRAYQMSNLKEFDEFAQWTDGVVNEVDDAANPKVQAVQKLIGQQPEKPNEPKTNVQLTPKGTVAIELGKGDKPGAARVAELIRSGKMPPGTSIVAMQEGQMQQFEATFEKNGKTVTKTISAVSQGSAEIQAYHMADATGSEIVGDVKPVSEGLGGDGDDADDLMTDVMKPGQEMYETGNKRISYDDTQLAQRVIDLHQRGESLSDLLDRFPQLQSMIDDIVVDYHYHPDDDHEEIQAQLIDNLEDIVKHGSRKSSADLAEADMEEGNEWTGARRAAIKAGEEHFTVGGKTYPVTGGDTSDEQKMTEGLNRILFLSGVRK